MKLRSQLKARVLLQESPQVVFVLLQSPSSAVPVVPLPPAPPRLVAFLRLTGFKIFSRLFHQSDILWYGILKKSPISCIVTGRQAMPFSSVYRFGASLRITRWDVWYADCSSRAMVAARHVMTSSFFAGEYERRDFRWVLCA